MRVAPDVSKKRSAPALPRTVVTIKQDDLDTPAGIADFTPPEEQKTVQTNVPKFINNEQPQDFFQGVGDVPAGETVLGSFFDSVFRPANPPNQPVSSTSYTVE